MSTILTGLSKGWRWWVSGLKALTPTERYILALESIILMGGNVAFYLIFDTIWAQIGWSAAWITANTGIKVRLRFPNTAPPLPGQPEPGRRVS